MLKDKQKSLFQVYGQLGWTEHLKLNVLITIPFSLKVLHDLQHNAIAVSVFQRLSQRLEICRQN